jgi:hypothetical protein
MTKTSTLASRCRSTLEAASISSPGRRKVGMMTEKSMDTSQIGKSKHLASAKTHPLILKEQQKRYSDQGLYFHDFSRKVHVSFV